MADLFLKIVNMSISASWIVLAVLLLRIVLKKAPKWINCILWGIVGLRLIMPLSLESVFSLIPSPQTISPEIMTNVTPEINTGIPILNSTINPVISDTFAPEIGASANSLQILIPIISVVWLIGIASLLVYTLISYLRLKNKVSTAVRFRDNIYQSEAVVSPFVLGIIRPKIYLPFNMAEQEMEHVIAHEQAHLRRKDHLWKPLGFIILTLHWFNPVMWLAYILLCRDIELACDEKVVKEFDYVQKADYSQALLACSVNRRMVAACPLAFGEVGVKDRVKSVLNYKKPAFWVIMVAIIASIVAAACFLTNPISADKIALGYYRETELIYSQRVTDYIPENVYGITVENQLYVIDGNGIVADIGMLDKSDLDNDRLQNFNCLSEVPNFDKITTALVARDWDSEDQIHNCTLHYIFKTKHGEVFMVVAYAPTLWLDGVIDEDDEVKIGEVGQITINEIRKLQYIGETYNENTVVREYSSETSERDFQIEASLMNQLDPPEGSLADGMPYTAASFHVLGEQCLRTENGTIDRYAVIFARYRYTYEDGQLFESGEANKAILEFEVESDGTYALIDCKEFILDGTEVDFEKEFNMLSSEAEYDTQQLSDTLTYECRVKAMNYYHIAYWTYAPMLSASWYYACPITFSVDYDKAVISCSDGTMVKEKLGEKNEEGSEMTYDRADTPIWCPVASDAESSKAADSAEISFTLYKNGKKAYKGTIIATYQNAFEAPLGSLYVLEMSSNRELVMAEGPTVRIGVRANEVRFYKERVLETESDRVVLSVHYLLPSEIKRLNEIMDSANWINADYASRTQLSLDGKFILDDKPIFFSDEMNVLYSAPYYAEIESEDMAFIMSLQGSREYKSDLCGLYSKLTLNLSSKFFEFTAHPLSSRIYYGDYEETENNIVIIDDETADFFTFRKSEGNLIFDAENSSPVPQYNGVENLKDGAVFTQ